MTTALAHPVRAHDAPATLERRRFTADEFDRMIAAGVIRDDERVELLDGEFVEMAAAGSKHVYTSTMTFAFFTRGLSLTEAVVMSECPLRVADDWQPLPDVMLLRPPAHQYVNRRPAPADVLLVIEVSDSTLRHDRQTKLPRYAAAGIPETWIFDLSGRRVFQFRQPSAEGYQQTRIIRRTGRVSPLAFPDLVLRVADVLPPEPDA